MKRIHSILAVALLGVWGFGVSGGSRAAQELLPNGTIIDASLSGALDAKKNKPGDRVEAHTVQDIKQDGKVLLKKGTRLTGHITQASAHTKDQPQSYLAIVFDHAVTKDRGELPLVLSIQALAAAQVSPAAGSDDAFGSATGLGGVAQQAGAGGDDNPVGPAPATERNPGNGPGAAQPPGAHSPGAVGGLTASGRLAPNSSGVFGLDGLSLRNVRGASATEGSVIISPNRTVHLDNGTQLLLTVVAAQTP